MQWRHCAFRFGMTNPMLALVIITCSVSGVVASRPAVTDVNALNLELLHSEPGHHLPQPPAEAHDVSKEKDIICAKDTGGSCMTEPCGESRNAVCTNWKCECPSDRCAVDGKCIKRGIVENAPEVLGNGGPSNEAGVGAEEEEEHHATHEDNALSAFMIAFITVIMIQLYLMNAADAQVKSYSNKLLSTLMAIYCAVLMEDASSSVWKQMFGMTGHNHAWQVQVATMFPLYLMWHLGSYPLGYRVRDHQPTFYAVETAVPHVGGFLAIKMMESIESKGTVIMKEKYGNPIWSYVCSILFALIFFRSLTHVVEVCMAKIYRNDESTEPQPSSNNGEARTSEGSVTFRTHVSYVDLPDDQSVANSASTEENDEDWVSEMAEGHEEACAMIVGRLLEKGLMFWVTNGANHKYIHTDMIVPEGDRAAWLFVSLACISWLLIMVAIHQFWMKERAGRIFLFLSATARFSCAWIFTPISWWIAADQTTGWTCCFLWHTCQVSVVSYMFIVICDRIADSYRKTEDYIEALVEVFGIVLALGWEKTFTLAAENVAELAVEREEESMGFGKTANIDFAYTKFIFCVGLVALMVPGWIWFIVPTAMMPTPDRDRGAKEELIRPTLARRTSAWVAANQESR